MKERLVGRSVYRWIEPSGGVPPGPGPHPRFALRSTCPHRTDHVKCEKRGEGLLEPAKADVVTSAYRRQSITR